MNIGLVRHFKVNCATKMFMTSYDFENIKWHKCLSSDLYRAVRTA